MREPLNYGRKRSANAHVGMRLPQQEHLFGIDADVNSPHNGRRCNRRQFHAGNVRRGESVGHGHHFTSDDRLGSHDPGDSTDRTDD